MHTCPRCQGSKIIEKFKHVESGICFECSGNGYVTEEEKQRIEKDIAREIKRSQTRINNDKEKQLARLKKEWFSNADIIHI